MDNLNQEIHDLIIESKDNNKNINEIKNLISSKEFIFGKNQDELYIASKYGKHDIFKLFLEKICNNSKEQIELNNNILKIAAKNGHLNIVKELLKPKYIKMGINPATNNNYPLRIAAIKGHHKIIEFLLQDKFIKMGVNPKSRNFEAIKMSNQMGHYGITCTLFDFVKNIKQKNLNNIDFKEKEQIRFINATKNNKEVSNTLINKRDSTKLLYASILIALRDGNNINIKDKEKIIQQKSKQLEGINDIGVNIMQYLIDKKTPLSLNRINCIMYKNKSPNDFKSIFKKIKVIDKIKEKKLNKHKLKNN